MRFLLPAPHWNCPRFTVVLPIAKYLLTINHFFKILSSILHPSLQSLLLASLPTYKWSWYPLPSLQTPHLSTYWPSVYTYLLMTPTARRDLSHEVQTPLSNNWTSSPGNENSTTSKMLTSYHFPKRPLSATNPPNNPWVFLGASYIQDPNSASNFSNLT